MHLCYLYILYTYIDLKQCLNYYDDAVSNQFCNITLHHVFFFFLWNANQILMNHFSLETLVPCKRKKVLIGCLESWEFDSCWLRGGA